MNASVYDLVTERIVEALERGVIPWRRPWSESPEPVNAVSKRPYRGVNILLLGLSDFRDHRWLTYKQAKDLGGYVKRGERSSVVVFWKGSEIQDARQEEGEAPRRSPPILRYYHVFNVEQCQDVGLSNECNVSSEQARIEQAEELVRAMPCPPAIQERGDSAWYRPSDDLIQVPPLDAFTSADSYYATLFHELGHATGHVKRLNRFGVMRKPLYASAEYSREELVAELTSAFCCASLGLDNSLAENSASYINGWLAVLEDDHRNLVAAAGLAQRATNYIRGLTSPVAEALGSLFQ
ncbi:MAG: hypothetical protein QOJ65_2594 [Fimbriimonadaceae bacterium]|jgi:antirestriction protein ArdC|nr:hypothetical protein [Fimbriimonadaceae bacterium]